MTNNFITKQLIFRTYRNNLQTTTKVKIEEIPVSNATLAFIRGVTENYVVTTSRQVSNHTLKLEK